jgi:rubrerythrin
MSEARPMTEQEAGEAVGRMLEEARQSGLWMRVCKRCGQHCGGRLASHGQPSEKDLALSACPACGSVGEMRVEFIPAEAV